MFWYIDCMQKDRIGQIVMWVIAFLTLLGVSLHIYEYLYYKYNIPPDNIFEEAIEDVLQNKTGINLDLSPESPE